MKIECVVGGGVESEGFVLDFANFTISIKTSTI